MQLNLGHEQPPSLSASVARLMKKQSVLPTLALIPITIVWRPRLWPWPT
jgi:hypothetical protein